jgi:glycerol uptake facilitator-like aquaporin
MKKIISEFLGMMTLTMCVVGSGIMAENISQGSEGITLLINSISTSAILIVIILTFRQISGAHFNPAVSLSFYIQNKLELLDFFRYVAAHITGGIVGIIFIHIMFDMNIFEFSSKYRDGLNIIFSEIVTSFLLVFIICMSQQKDDMTVALLVGLYIGAGYFFSSSTSFANPAITVARIFTDSYTGIHISNIAGFISAQLIGSYLATITYKYLKS